MAKTPPGQIYPEDLAGLSPAAREQILAAMATVKEEDAVQPTDSIVIVDEKKKPKTVKVSKLNAKGTTQGKPAPISATPQKNSFLKGVFNNAVRSLADMFDSAFPLFKVFKERDDDNADNSTINKTSSQRVIDETNNTNKLLASTLSEQQIALELLSNIDKKLLAILAKQEENEESVGGVLNNIVGKGSTGGTGAAEATTAARVGGTTATKAILGGGVAAVSLTGIDKILAMTGKLETGSEGSAGVYKDPGGGHSYGLLGLNSGKKDKGGSIHTFVKNNPQLGLTAKPGTPEFEIQWKNLAKTQPEILKAAERDYYKNEVLSGTQDRMTRGGIPENIANDPRVMTYFADREIQQGKGSTYYPRTQDRIKEALKQSGQDPVKFLEAFNTIDASKKSMMEDFPTAVAAGGYGLAGHQNRTSGRLKGALEAEEVLNLKGTSTTPSAATPTSTPVASTPTTGSTVNKASVASVVSSRSMNKPPEVTINNNSSETVSAKRSMAPPIDPHEPGNVEPDHASINYARWFEMGQVWTSSGLRDR